MRVFKIKKQKKDKEDRKVLGSECDLAAAKKMLFAEQLRNAPTESERLFYEFLERTCLEFEFQPVICGYIPDFYFPKHGKRIIELDGKCHDKKKAYDRKRDDILRKAGYKILRVASSRVFYDFDRLRSDVLAFLAGKHVKKRKRLKRMRPIVRTADPLLEQFHFATDGI